METVITRIMEIEKQSAMDVKRAEEACRNRIEAHRQALEEEKEQAHALIITKENTRLAEVLQALNEKTEEESRAAGEDHERLYQDPTRVDAIKEKIAAILLAR